MDSLDTLGKPCYDMRALYRNLDVMTTLLAYMQELGWGPYANDHEDANCQFEINWAYSDALAHRGSHYVVQMDGANCGRSPRTVGDVHAEAVFAPHRQWRAFPHEPGRCGNEGQYFSRCGDPLGLSQIGRWFMGGVLHHAEALAAITAPLVNSYKRLIRGAPRSGATRAPVYVTVWAGESHADDPNTSRGED